jgi:uncharacterized FAD-dependent dehydrogenase
MKHYDVIIVGAGPAGIFAAHEIVSSGKGVKVLLIEKGKDIEERICPSTARDISCKTCPECSLLCGWGGAGAYSDGKLSLSKEIGGNLSRYISQSELQELINYTDGLYVKYGAPRRVYGEDEKRVNNLKKIAAKNKLTLIPSKIRHIGTDRCPVLLKKIKAELNSKVEILFSKNVNKILIENEKVIGVGTGNGKKIYADFVVVAPGREGALWLENQAKTMGLSLLKNPVDIGVRVELPASVLDPLTKIIYEPKLIFYSRKFHDRIRTFCVNPYGEVVREYVKGVWIVNGHSYSLFL